MLVTPPYFTGDSLQGQAEDIGSTAFAYHRFDFLEDRRREHCTLQYVSVYDRPPSSLPPGQGT